MHELSIASAVLATALEHAGERQVAVVAMRVGALRQVVPDSLRFYWEIVTRETVCEHSRLEVTEIETRMRCEDCAREWVLNMPVFRCPDCASAHVAVTAGEELQIDYLELREPVHA